MVFLELLGSRNRVGFCEDDDFCSKIVLDCGMFLLFCIFFRVLNSCWVGSVWWGLRVVLIVVKFGYFIKKLDGNIWFVCVLIVVMIDKDSRLLILRFVKGMLLLIFLMFIFNLVVMIFLIVLVWFFIGVLMESFVLVNGVYVWFWGWLKMLFL